MRLGMWLFARVPPCDPYCFRGICGRALTTLGAMKDEARSQKPRAENYIVFSSELTRNVASVAL